MNYIRFQASLFQASLFQASLFLAVILLAVFVSGSAWAQRVDIASIERILVTAGSSADTLPSHSALTSGTGLTITNISGTNNASSRVAANVGDSNRNNLSVGWRITYRSQAVADSLNYGEFRYLDGTRADANDGSKRQDIVFNNVFQIQCLGEESYTPQRCSSVPSQFWNRVAVMSSNSSPVVYVLLNARRAALQGRTRLSLTPFVNVASGSASLTSTSGQASGARVDTIWVNNNRCPTSSECAAANRIIHLVRAGSTTDGPSTIASNVKRFSGDAFSDSSTNVGTFANPFTAADNYQHGIGWEIKQGSGAFSTFGSTHTLSSTANNYRLTCDGCTNTVIRIRTFTTIDGRQHVRVVPSGRHMPETAIKADSWPVKLTLSHTGRSDLNSYPEHLRTVYYSGGTIADVRVTSIDVMPSGHGDPGNFLMDVPDGDTVTQGNQIVYTVNFAASGSAVPGTPRASANLTNNFILYSVRCNSHPSRIPTTTDSCDSTPRVTDARQGVTNGAIDTRKHQVTVGNLPTSGNVRIELTASPVRPRPEGTVVDVDLSSHQNRFFYYQPQAPTIESISRHVLGAQPQTGNRPVIATGDTAQNPIRNYGTSTVTNGEIGWEATYQAGDTAVARGFAPDPTNPLIYRNGIYQIEVTCTTPSTGCLVAASGTQQLRSFVSMPSANGVNETITFNQNNLRGIGTITISADTSMPVPSGVTRPNFMAGSSTIHFNLLNRDSNTRLNRIALLPNQPVAGSGRLRWRVTFAGNVDATTFPSGVGGDFGDLEIGGTLMGSTSFVRVYPVEVGTETEITGANFYSTEFIVETYTNGDATTFATTGTVILSMDSNAGVNGRNPDSNFNTPQTPGGNTATFAAGFGSTEPPQVSSVTVPQNSDGSTGIEINEARFIVNFNNPVVINTLSRDSDGMLTNDDFRMHVASIPSGANPFRVSQALSAGTNYQVYPLNPQMQNNKMVASSFAYQLTSIGLGAAQSSQRIILLPSETGFDKNDGLTISVPDSIDYEDALGNRQTSAPTQAQFDLRPSTLNAYTEANILSITQVRRDVGIIREGSMVRRYAEGGKNYVEATLLLTHNNQIINTNADNDEFEASVFRFVPMETGTTTTVNNYEFVGGNNNNPLVVRAEVSSLSPIFEFGIGNTDTAATTPFIEKIQGLGFRDGNFPYDLLITEEDREALIGAPRIETIAVADSITAHPTETNLRNVEITVTFNEAVSITAGSSQNILTSTPAGLTFATPTLINPTNNRSTSARVIATFNAIENDASSFTISASQQISDYENITDADGNAASPSPATATFTVPQGPTLTGISNLGFPVGNAVGRRMQTFRATFDGAIEGTLANDMLVLTSDEPNFDATQFTITAGRIAEDNLTATFIIEYPAEFMQSQSITIAGNPMQIRSNLFAMGNNVLVAQVLNSAGAKANWSPSGNEGQLFENIRSNVSENNGTYTFTWDLQLRGAAVSEGILHAAPPTNTFEVANGTITNVQVFSRSLPNANQEAVNTFPIPTTAAFFDIKVTATNNNGNTEPLVLTLANNNGATFIEYAAGMFHAHDTFSATRSLPGQPDVSSSNLFTTIHTETQLHVAIDFGGRINGGRFSAISSDQTINIVNSSGNELTSNATINTNFAADGVYFFTVDHGITTGTETITITLTDTNDSQAITAADGGSLPAEFNAGGSVTDEYELVFENFASSGLAVPTATRPSVTAVTRMGDDSILRTSGQQVAWNITLSAATANFATGAVQIVDASTGIILVPATQVAIAGGGTSYTATATLPDMGNFRRVPIGLTLARNITATEQVFPVISPTRGLALEQGPGQPLLATGFGDSTFLFAANSATAPLVDSVIRASSSGAPRARTSQLDSNTPRWIIIFNEAVTQSNTAGTTDVDPTDFNIYEVDADGTNPRLVESIASTALTLAAGSTIADYTCPTDKTCVVVAQSTGLNNYQTGRHYALGFSSGAMIGDEQVGNTPETSLPITNGAIYTNADTTSATPATTAQIIPMPPRVQNRVGFGDFAWLVKFDPAMQAPNIDGTGAIEAADFDIRIPNTERTLMAGRDFELETNRARPNEMVVRVLASSEVVALVQGADFTTARGLQLSFVDRDTNTANTQVTFRYLVDTSDTTRTINSGDEQTSTITLSQPPLTPAVAYTVTSAYLNANVNFGSVLTNINTDRASGIFEFCVSANDACVDNNRIAPTEIVDNADGSYEVRLNHQSLADDIIYSLIIKGETGQDMGQVFAANNAELLPFDMVFESFTVDVSNLPAPTILSIERLSQTEANPENRITSATEHSVWWRIAFSAPVIINNANSNMGITCMIAPANTACPTTGDNNFGFVNPSDHRSFPITTYFPAHTSGTGTILGPDETTIGEGQLPPISTATDFTSSFPTAAQTNSNLANSYILVRAPRPEIGQTITLSIDNTNIFLTSPATLYGAVTGTPTQLEAVPNSLTELLTYQGEALAVTSVARDPTFADMPTQGANAPDMITYTITYNAAPPTPVAPTADSSSTSQYVAMCTVFENGVTTNQMCTQQPHIESVMAGTNDTHIVVINNITQTQDGEITLAAATGQPTFTMVAPLYTVAPLMAEIAGPMRRISPMNPTANCPAESATGLAAMCDAILFRVTFSHRVARSDLQGGTFLLRGGAMGDTQITRLGDVNPSLAGADCNDDMTACRVYDVEDVIADLSSNSFDEDTILSLHIASGATGATTTPTINDIAQPSRFLGGETQHTVMQSVPTTQNTIATMPFEVTGPPQFFSITRLDIEQTTGGEVRWQVQFNQAVTGVEATDFEIRPALTDDLEISGTGANYIITATLPTENINTVMNVGLHPSGTAAELDIESVRLDDNNNPRPLATLELDENSNGMDFGEQTYAVQSNRVMSVAKVFNDGASPITPATNGDDLDNTIADNTIQTVVFVVTYRDEVADVTGMDTNTNNRLYNIVCRNIADNSNCFSNLTLTISKDSTENDTHRVVVSGLTSGLDDTAFEIRLEAGANAINNGAGIDSSNLAMRTAFFDRRELDITRVQGRRAGTGIVTFDIIFHRPVKGVTTSIVSMVQQGIEGSETEITTGISVAMQNAVDIGGTNHARTWRVSVSGITEQRVVLTTTSGMVAGITDSENNQLVITTAMESVVDTTALVAMRPVESTTILRQVDWQIEFSGPIMPGTFSLANLTLGGTQSSFVGSLESADNVTFTISTMTQGNIGGEVSLTANNIDSITDMAGDALDESMLSVTYTFMLLDLATTEPITREELPANREGMGTMADEFNLTLEQITYTINYAQIAPAPQANTYAITIDCEGCQTRQPRINIARTNDTTHTVTVSNIPRFEGTLTLANGTLNYGDYESVAEAIRQVHIDRVSPDVDRENNGGLVSTSEENANPRTWTVHFTEVISGLDENNVNVTGTSASPTITAVSATSGAATSGAATSGFSAEWQISVPNPDNENIGVAIITAADSTMGARDMAGNPLLTGIADEVRIEAAMDIIRTFTIAAAENIISNTPNLTGRLSRIDTLNSARFFNFNMDDESSNMNYQSEFKGGKHAFTMNENGTTTSASYSAEFTSKGLGKGLWSRARSKDMEVWVQANYAKTEGEGFNESTSWFINIGVDRSFGENKIGGILLQLDQTEQTRNQMEVQGELQMPSAKSQGWLVGPYIVLARDNFNIEARAAYGMATTELKPFGDRYTDEYDSERFLASGSISRDFDAGSWTVSPRLNISYFNQEQESYISKDNSQSGAGREVRVPSSKYEASRLSLGPTISKQYKLDDGSVLTPKLGLTGNIDKTEYSGLMVESTEYKTGQINLTLLFSGRSGITINLGGYMDILGDTENLESYGATGGISIKF